MRFLYTISAYAGSALVAAAAVLLSTALPAAGEVSPEEEKIFEEKCSPCHATSRVLRVAPDRVRETIARMEAKNPAFFEDVSGDQLAEIASRMLSDPQVAAQRKALEEAVAEGKALFADKSLGRNGKSCADCHSEDSLRGKVEDFPRFVEKEGRLMSLNETINLMISSNMSGKVLPLGDERAIALEAYLRSLR